MKNCTVLGTRIDAATRDAVAQEIVGRLREKNTSTVAKVNAEFLLRSLDDLDFQVYLSACDINIADGIGVLWAARFLTLSSTTIPVLRRVHVLWQAAYSLSSLLFYQEFCRNPIPERIPGVEALYLMLEAAQDADASVFFLGAEHEVNEKARRAIGNLYPRLNIAGGRDGYFQDDAEVVKEIDSSGAKLLIVALGSPKQEYWIRDHGGSLRTVAVAVGEGGSLDFVAGAFRRAPSWMQSAGLEWFWRLFMNRSKSPTGSRLKRVWNAVPVFIYHVVKWKWTYGATQAP